MFNVDLTIHIGEFLTLCYVAYRVVKALSRVESLLRDFPPHRHVNGSVIYPEGFEPTAVQKLGLKQ